MISIFSLLKFSAPGSTYDTSHAMPRVDIDPPSVFDMHDLNAGGTLYVPLAY